MHQANEETLFTNNRPVSFLPALPKTFEKVIFKQVYHFLKKQKCFIMHNMDSELSTLHNLLL